MKVVAGTVVDDRRRTRNIRVTALQSLRGLLSSRCRYHNTFLALKEAMDCSSDPSRSLRRKGRTFLQCYSYDYPCAALGNAAHQSQSTRLAYGNATRRFFGQRGYHRKHLKKTFPAP